MITFGMPKDKKLLAAMGRVAIADSQLNFILRMTIKSILGLLSVQDARDRTYRKSSSKLRKLIKREARRKLGEGEALSRLEEILTRVACTTERRNKLLHGLFAENIDTGEQLIWGADNTFRKLPPVEELRTLEDEFEALRLELDEARREGFLYKAIEAARRP